MGVYRTFFFEISLYAYLHALPNLVFFLYKEQKPGATAVLWAALVLVEAYCKMRLALSFFFSYGQKKALLLWAALVLVEAHGKMRLVGGCLFPCYCKRTHSIVRESQRTHSIAREHTVAS